MNFGFLLFNDLEELDLVGPWEMIGMWGEYAGGPGERLMIAETKEPVSCTNGMRILSVPQEWQIVVTGLIIILAVFLDILRRQAKNK